MAGLGKKGVDIDGSTVLVEPPPPVVGQGGLAHALHQSPRHLLPDHLLRRQQGVQFGQPAGDALLQHLELSLQMDLLELAGVAQDMQVGRDLALVCRVGVPLFTEQGVGAVGGQLLGGGSEPEQRE